jgi:hypothetical protein
MKTAELTGAMLDYWVAQVERSVGVEVYIRSDNGLPQCIMRGGPETWFCPSINWAQGGPIADENWFEITNWLFRYLSPEWYGDICDKRGSTLIWFMRAYVASKFGEEVPDDAQCDPPPILTPK